MLDYNKEYDPMKVDTPENRRGMVRLLKIYGYDSAGNVPKFNDPEGRDVPSLIVYLNILADYSDPDIDRPESLEAAMDLWKSNLSNDAYYIPVFDRLRYFSLIYVSANPDKRGWPVFGDINIEGEKVKAFYAFTRRKWAAKSYAGKCFCHHISIYDIIAVCRQEGVTDIIVNPGDNIAAFNTGNLQACLDNYDMIDAFWADIRKNGVAGEDLFPLLAQDFLHRDVICVFRNGKSAMGYAMPYESWQAPGYNIRSSDGKTVYVSLDNIKAIGEVPEKYKKYI